MADADKAAPSTDPQPDERERSEVAVAKPQPSPVDERQRPDADSAQPESEAEPKTKAEPKAEPEPKARAEPEAEAEPELKAKAEPEPKAKATAKPAARRKADEHPTVAQSTGHAGLKLHHLRPAPGARKAKTRVGRGEASKGKTAGRGTKGTKARDAVAPRFEGGQMPLHRRVPKLKGFSNLRFKTTYQVVNTARLAELYPQGGDVTPEDLVAKGAVRKGELVKILGTGDLPTAVRLRVSAHAFSASAKEKITAVGG